MSEINTDKRESILAKIRALMAKTPENGCTEAEAKAAAAMVDTLLEKYEIDLDEVALRKQEFTQAEIMNGWLHPVGQAATGIAKFTDCKCWISEKKKIVYFGFSVDCEIAEYLTLLFKRAIDREAAAFTLFNADYDAATKPADSSTTATPATSPSATTPSTTMPSTTAPSDNSSSSMSQTPSTTTTTSPSSDTAAAPSADLQPKPDRN